VVAGTIREKVPDNFPLAEFHLERGFVDAVVPRRDLKKTLDFLLATHARGQGGRP
jgi:acetyl-CoA carboxylase carboxyl transferase subunit beta